MLYMAETCSVVSVPTATMITIGTSTTVIVWFSFRLTIKSASVISDV